MPIVTLPEAKILAEQWRHEGHRVGFTNGCFDLIHAGHVATLRFAKEHCGRLIVGLDSDESVTRHKGPGRPINNEAHRAAVLSEMRCVDAVVVFGYGKLEWLIREIAPDLIIKGSDYADRYVIGSTMRR